MIDNNIHISYMAKKLIVEKKEGNMILVEKRTVVFFKIMGEIKSSFTPS